MTYHCCSVRVAEQTVGRPWLELCLLAVQGCEACAAAQACICCCSSIVSGLSLTMQRMQGLSFRLSNAWWGE